MKMMTPPADNRGFTLIELLVSLALFVIVVVAAIGSLYSVNQASRKVEAMRGVLDNLEFAVESISRTVRTGNSLVCGGLLNANYAVPGTASATHNCPYGTGVAPGTYLLLNSTLGATVQVQYRWWQDNNGNGQIQKQIKDPTSGTWGNWVSLTSSQINIQKLSFYVSGANTDDDSQPSVILMLSGRAVSGQDVTPFAIQTLVSQRAIKK